MLPKIFSFDLLFKDGCPTRLCVLLGITVALGLVLGTLAADGSLMGILANSPLAELIAYLHIKRLVRVVYKVPHKWLTPLVNPDKCKEKDPKTGKDRPCREDRKK